MTGFAGVFYIVPRQN